MNAFMCVKMMRLICYSLCSLQISIWFNTCGTFRQNIEQETENDNTCLVFLIKFVTHLYQKRLAIGKRLLSSPGLGV